MTLLINISCSIGEAEKTAYAFCLEALQSGLEIYRLFFSGSIVTSALKPNSVWMKLCQSNNINGVCCSHSVEQHKEALSVDTFDTKKSSRSKAISNTRQDQTSSPIIEPGGLALLVEGAVKSDAIVNFNDANYSIHDAFEIIKQSTAEYLGASKKNKEKYLLSLSASAISADAISEPENYDSRRLQRLIDSAAVFLVFEQSFSMLLEVSILQSVNKERIMEDIKTLSELGLKRLSFSSTGEFSSSDKRSNTGLPESLSVLIADLKIAGIECEIHPYSHYNNLHRKHITF